MSYMLGSIPIRRNGQYSNMIGRFAITAERTQSPCSEQVKL